MLPHRAARNAGFRMSEASGLKILHVLRAPVGGLFRHVLDLARGQAQRGHRVGIVAGADGGAQATEKLDQLALPFALGVTRLPMQRQPGLADVAALRSVALTIKTVAPDVLHGHGAKGGAYARLAPAGKSIRVYTPHGGSLHFSSRTPQGLLYGVAERLMMRRTDLCLFESAYAHQKFITRIGEPNSLVRVVHNGIGAEEFSTVEPAQDATDIVMIGELRHIKGVDVLIEAIDLLAQRGRKITATIVGEGPDRTALQGLARQRGLSDAVRFAGYQPAREAFALGRLLVVASRAESLPYVVIEAAAAGVPMIATNVGGIPEIFGPDAGLLPPGDPVRLADAIVSALDDPGRASAQANRLRERARTRFSRDAMVDQVLAAYGDAMRTRFR
jgi:glycosyltransferase involved in cell wall biosynthesis